MLKPQTLYLEFDFQESNMPNHLCQVHLLLLVRGGVFIAPLLPEKIRALEAATMEYRWSLHWVNQGPACQIRSPRQAPEVVFAAKEIQAKGLTQP